MRKVENSKKNGVKIIQLEKLSWKKIDKLEKDKTIFFLPISPLEEHGPHLPVGTDLLTAEDTAKEAIKILIGKKPELTYILMPRIPLGYCKLNSDFPGSISVRSNVIKNIIIEVCSSLAIHGFKYMVICTPHLAIGHLKGIYSAMEKIKRKYGMNLCEPWSPYFYNNEIEKNEPKLGFDTSRELHAGFRETSLMKYQYPYLVDETHKNLQSIYRDLQSPMIIGKTFKDLGLTDGYVGSPSKADADYGRWFFTQIVEVYVKAAIDLFEGRYEKELPRNIKRAMKALFWI